MATRALGGPQKELRGPAVRHAVGPWNQRQILSALAAPSWPPSHVHGAEGLAARLRRRHDGHLGLLAGLLLERH